ncbi:hypothetical protein [Clostridium sp. KNHs214]|uniref:hypothetical protein n=1 Tax=Clostridium sp. KNHs214 TaxID=1540257 RepID=UPI0006897968|nr:hypothetical protein [Clostridium sp. KNHs214]
MTSQQYYEINKKYLAESLAYLGFEYYKFNDNDRFRYSFKNTEQFQKALNDMVKLRKKYNTYANKNN